tara:strand:+ start:102 stop:266 length:165 start_codon:yes stop_codon:yes gene_type:complete
MVIKTPLTDPTDVMWEVNEIIHRGLECMEYEFGEDKDWEVGLIKAEPYTKESQF